MVLGARILTDVNNVNSYRVVSQIESICGSTIDVYLQLIDGAADRESSPPGRRFVPATNSTLAIAIRSVTPSKQLTYSAVQPFPVQDPSIWKFQIKSSDVPVSTPSTVPQDWSFVNPVGQAIAATYRQYRTVDVGLVGDFGLLMTLTENPSWTASAVVAGVEAGEQFVLNGVTFTAVASGGTGTQFNIGLNDDITAANLATVINNNSSVCQCTATSNGGSVIVTAIRAASIVWSTSSGHIVLGTPVLGPNARVTQGFCARALSIAPSMPGF